MKIQNEIKRQWEKDRVVTGFMLVVVVLSVLTFITPGYTESIWSYFALTAFNFSILAFVIGAIMYWWRKSR